MNLEWSTENKIQEHRVIQFFKCTNGSKIQINHNAVLVSDLNTPLSPVDLFIKKSNHIAHDIMNEMELKDDYRTFHLITKEHTFSAAHWTFLKEITAKKAFQPI